VPKFLLGAAKAPCANTIVASLFFIELELFFLCLVIPKSFLISFNFRAAFDARENFGMEYGVEVAKATRYVYVRVH
jgi:hypothetical protein